MIIMSADHSVPSFKYLRRCRLGTVYAGYEVLASSDRYLGRYYFAYTRVAIATSGLASGVLQIASVA